MSSALAALVPRLAGRRVVVAGDVVLDEYLYGRPERLSREAAIPVLAYERRQIIPGGAANPAANIAALGSSAESVALVGDDPAGRELRDALAERGVGVAGLLAEPGRATTTKTRILAAVPLTVAQQVARIDRIDRRPPDPRWEDAAIAALERAVPGADAVLCSDYRAGFLSERILAAIGELCRRHGALLTVDSQGRFDAYRGASFLKCNADEAAGWLGAPLREEVDFERGLARLRGELGLGAVAVTRGGAGFSLLDAAGYHHIPAVPVGEVFDATGAGDTFVAAATLALAAGLDPLAAARLANAAAALVVRRIGVAVVTPPELAAILEHADEPVS
ncbi:MAG TPA: PfkB family carbohydrate kinase [Herpetosiphonaceae bacterium]